MKKNIAILLVIVLLAGSLMGCVHAPQETQGSVSAEPSAAVSSEPAASAAGEESRLTSKMLPLYYFSQASQVEVPLYYVDGQTDIPYIPIDAAVEMLTYICRDVLQDTEYKITAENSDGAVQLERENGSAVELDFNKNSIIYGDFNGFFQKSFSATALDIVSIKGVNGNGEPEYIDRPAASFQRQGLPISVDLTEHGINMIYEDGTGYLPLQTFSDLFVAQTGVNILYNGQMAAVIAGGNLGDLEDIYYSAPTGKRSKELAEFSYNELCLALEMNYGLKESHNIESFDKLFIQTGLDDELKGEDPAVADRAIATLCMGYFADMHSGLLKPSYYAGKDTKTLPESMSTSLIDSIGNMQRYDGVRKRFYPDGTPTYEEIGNTAYVTFDSFSLPTTVDYYETPATAEAEDTIGIIMYAHSQIMRENSPVENVVIDLSNNGGGQADAAVYVMGWFLGTCTLNIDDTLTEAQASTRYQIDANGDRVFDENDTVASKNLYCIISPNSFSCGNLVPSAFKNSGTVTLLGEASGGGACVVQELTTADGTILQVSGRKRISTLSNGSYYDVDQGVEPDFVITRIENFYDRKNLTEYISSLY